MFKKSGKGNNPSIGQTGNIGNEKSSGGKYPFLPNDYLGSMNRPEKSGPIANNSSSDIPFLPKSPEKF